MGATTRPTVRMLACLGALLAPGWAGATEATPGEPAELVEPLELASPLAVDAAPAIEPIPDATTPGGSASSVTVVPTLALGGPVALLGELVQPLVDGPLHAPALLLGGSIAQAVGPLRLALLVARPVTPEAPLAPLPSTVVEASVSLEAPLSPALAVRRTLGEGAGTEVNLGLGAALTEQLRVDLAARTVATGGALDAGALAVVSFAE